MRCGQCGREYQGIPDKCPFCGAVLHYGGNTEFYGKAARATLAVKDLFSDALKKHPKGAGAKLFTAGTPLSTPTPDRMLVEWQKPWLFLRVLAVGLLFGLLCYFNARQGYGSGVYTLFSLGTLILPVSILIFFWEINIPRNIPLYTVLVVFLLGGILSLIFPDYLGQSGITSDTAYLAAFTEEPAKLIALSIFLWYMDTPYIFNGLLIGASVGTGFACMETISYVLSSGSPLNTLMTRSILAVGGHITWAAIEGGALAMVKGSQRLKLRHFLDSRFLLYLAASVAMHFLWNSRLSLVRMPIFIDLKYLLLCTAAILVVFSLVKKAIVQVLAVAGGLSSAAPDIRKPDTQNAALTIVCTGGPLSGQQWKIGPGVLLLGRDRGCSIQIPANTRGVSRQHCRLLYEQTVWLVEDLHAAYGTYVSGSPLPRGGKSPLKSGDTIWLGSRDVAFQVWLD